jgi:hypothetical protein
MKHRIVDADGRGVELDDSDPHAVEWARDALRRMPATLSPSDELLREGLRAFVERATAGQ